MRNFTATEAFGFTVETWQAFSDGIDRHQPGDFSARRCERPECLTTFSPAKSWARYCCEACRRADDNEARRVGHLIARPAMLAQAGKHAKPGTKKAILASTARSYVDYVLRSWREGRDTRRAKAEAAEDGREAA